MACVGHVDEATRPPPDICLRPRWLEYASATCAGRLVGQKRSFAAFFDSVPVFLIYGKFCGENIYRRGGGGLSTPCKCALECVCKRGKSEKKEEPRFLTPLKLSHLGTCGGLFGFGAHPSSVKHVVDAALVSSRRRVLCAKSYYFHASLDEGFGGLVSELILAYLTQSRTPQCSYYSN